MPGYTIRIKKPTRRSAFCAFSAKQELLLLFFGRSGSRSSRGSSVSGRGCRSGRGSSVSGRSSRSRSSGRGSSFRSRGRSRSGFFFFAASGQGNGQQGSDEERLFHYQYLRIKVALDKTRRGRKLSG